MADTQNTDIKELNSWTIFFSPADFPDKFVARRFVLNKPTKDHHVEDTIISIRSWVLAQNSNLLRIERSDEDALSVIETWIQHDISC